MSDLCRWSRVLAATFHRLVVHDTISPEQHPSVMFLCCEDPLMHRPRLQDTHKVLSIRRRCLLKSSTVAALHLCRSRLILSDHLSSLCDHKVCRCTHLIS